LLTAKQGSLKQGSRVVTFNGDVELRPQGPNVKTPVTLRTNQLSVDTQHNSALAPGQVSITMNRQTLTAVGLRADLQRQTIRLDSQVHGEFAW
jgi:LPS export ABC transporter protein LptC